MNIRDVIKKLDGMGRDISERTIRNYESWGVIPPATKEWLGRGKGSDVSYTDDTPKQVYAAFYILKFRGVSVEELRYIRLAGLRLVTDPGLFDYFVLEEVEQAENEAEFFTQMRRLKGIVYPDISHKWMIRIHSDVCWWAWLYAEAEQIINGKVAKIPASRRLGSFQKFVNRLLSEDDYTLPLGSG